MKTIPICQRCGSTALAQDRQSGGRCIVCHTRNNIVMVDASRFDEPQRRRASSTHVSHDTRWRVAIAIVARIAILVYIAFLLWTIFSEAMR